MRDDSMAVLEDVIRYTARKLPDAKCRAVLQALDESDEPRLISEKQAAELLAVSKSFLWRWRQGKIAGEFPFHVFHPPGDTGVKYDYCELIAYITEHMHNPHQEDPQS